MLDAIRRRKGSPIVKAILIGIAITFFGGFGLLGYCSRQDRAKEREFDRAATVNETIITITQVNRLATNKRSREDQPMSEAEWVKAREDVLDSLINMELVYEEAKRLDIQATDDEVQKNIIQAFQMEGVFQPDLYRSFLERQGYEEGVFQALLRKEIIIRKMMQLVGGAATVSDEDISQVYKYESEQTDLDMIVIDPEIITNVAQPTTTEIKLRYDQNQEGYTIAEKRQIKYTCFDSVQVARSSNVTEEEIINYYERIKDLKFSIKPRKVHVRQIVLSLNPESPDEEKNKIREKAKQVLADARLGTSPFDNLATLYSDDQVTKQKGGDMGWFELASKPIDIVRAIQPLEPGEISEIVEDPKGLYIYKLDEEQPGVYKPISQVRKDIVEILQKSGGSQLAHKAAVSMLETIRDGKSYDEAVKAATAEAHLSQFFDQTAKEVRGIPSPTEKIIEASFKLYQENQVSDVVDVDSGSCVVQLAKIEDKHDASYEEAIPMIKEELMAEARKKKASEIAIALLKKIEEGMSFDAAAKQPGAKLFNTGYFARGRGQIPNVGYSEEMITTAFSLPPHDPVAKKIFDAGGKLYLVKLKGHRNADPAGFDKAKPSLQLRLTVRRQGELVNSWIEALKARAKIDRKSFAPEAGQG